MAAGERAHGISAGRPVRRGHKLSPRRFAPSPADLPMTNSSTPNGAASPDAPFTPVSNVGEFGLIDRLHARLGDAARADGLIDGIGDDAAVIALGNGRVQVVTTDALVEGVHVDRTFAPMRTIGWKAIATNVSDVCAMNAQPRWATVALGLPNDVSVEAAEALYGGIAEACARYGVAVVGGDVTAAPRLVLSVTLIGEADEASVVTRRGAQPSDLLCVTGDLGAAAAGLQVLLAGRDQPVDLGQFGYAVERQLMPQARLDRVRLWAERGFRPTALVDISDGLASETHHLCAAGVVGAVVDAGALPVHVETLRAAERFGARPEPWVLYGGEDYELLFTAPDAELAKLPPDTYAVVGEITAPEDGVRLRVPQADGSETLAPLAAGGYKHY